MTRIKNPITSAKDPRAGGRCYAANGPGDLGKLTCWVDEQGDVLGMQLDLAFGAFVTKRVTPKKKYY